MRNESHCIGVFGEAVALIPSVKEHCLTEDGQAVAHHSEDLQSTHPNSLSADLAELAEGVFRPLWDQQTDRYPSSAFEQIAAVE